MLKIVKVGERRSMASINSLKPKLFYVINKDSTAVYKGNKRLGRYKAARLTTAVKKARDHYTEVMVVESRKALKVFDSLMAIRQKKEMAAQLKASQAKSLDSIFGVVRTTNVTNKLVDRLNNIKNKGTK